jgi:DNA-binding CsgD family transcriptional regulator
VPEEDEYALSVYQALRSRGGLAAAALRKAAGLSEEQTRHGLARLRELGLVEEREGRLDPVEPDTAVVQTMEAMHRGAEELIRVQRLTRALVSVYRPAASREASQVEVEYVTGRRRKDRLMLDFNTTVRQECASLHPGPMPPMDVLEGSLSLDEVMLARGVRVRAIYPIALLQTPKHVRYLQRLEGLGVEVRLVEHAAYDLLIFDRAVACVPGDPDNPGESMLVVRGSALIKTYAAMYEDYWLRSVPLDAGTAAASVTRLTSQERVVFRLMAGGLTDDQIARRLGVHRRTVQRAVTKLMERLGVASRFEAGLRLAQDPEFARAARRVGPPAH